MQYTMVQNVAPRWLVLRTYVLNIYTTASMWETMWESGWEHVGYLWEYVGYLWEHVGYLWEYVG
jgi:hypothetical protein